MKILILAMILVTGVVVQAAEISVLGRAFTNSCGYYSNAQAEVVISYKNTDLPWGSQVVLIHGLNGSDLTYGNHAPLEWERQGEREFSASAPYTWEGPLTLSLHSRSSSQVFDRLAMVFKITLPDGSVRFDNGGSAMGFYEARLYQGQLACRDEGRAQQELSPLTVRAVAR